MSSPASTASTNIKNPQREKPQRQTPKGGEKGNLKMGQKDGVAQALVERIQLYQ